MGFCAVLPLHLIRDAFTYDDEETVLQRVSFVVGWALFERLLTVLGQLWFLRYLVLGRKETDAAAEA